MINKKIRLLGSALLLSIAAVSGWIMLSAPPELSAQEQTLLAGFALQQQATAHDPSNRFVNNPIAIRLGKQLFLDKRLSKNGQISCASCHQADKAFTDNKALAQALKTGRRNTPTLENVVYNQWFFWDGRKDSLWSQALGPLEDPAEHGQTRVEIIRTVLEDTNYRQQYSLLLDKLPTLEWLANLPQAASPLGTLQQLQQWKRLPTSDREQIDQLFATTGKFIAAYVSTLVTPANQLDNYLQDTSTSLNSEVLAGAKLFIGKAQCIICHAGPMFTNHSFHNIGTGKTGVDTGRAAVLDKIRTDRFNCRSKYSDNPQAECKELQFMTRSRHTVHGSYKVPGLRNITQTAPYFHDGQTPSLEAVIEHYVTQSQKPEQDTDLPRIDLSTEEQRQLVAFLQIL